MARPHLFTKRIGTGRPVVFVHGIGIDHQFHLPLDQFAAGYQAFRQHVWPAAAQDCSRTVDRLERAYDLRFPPEQGRPPYTKPTLMLCGRDDQVVGYADQFELALKYPEATYTALADAGHNAIYDNRQAVGRHLSEWLRRM
jgi:pimeloyl-ACP methyl ester carboxylesterase